MHHVMGYSWDEIAAISTVITAIALGLIWLLNFAIKNGTAKLSETLEKLTFKVETLNDTMNSIKSTANRTAERLDKLEDNFEEHIGEAKVRNTRIKNLEQEVFKKKSR